MTKLALYLLGEARIECDGQAVQFDTRKATALLAYLAATRSAHSRDALATLLYPESDQAKSRGALRRTLSALKQALGDEWLDVDRETIGLAPRRGLWVDLYDFRNALAQCTRHGHAANDVCSRCLEPLAKAASLYRDDFLTGFTLRDSSNFDDWQFFESETLRRELVTALAKLVCRASEDARYEQAISAARRWLALEPLEEPGHRQLMRLYAWTGQRTAALRQYRECVRLLEQELGVAPLQETTDLSLAIEENRVTAPPRPPARAPTQPIPVSAAPPPPHPLPAPAYPLVGRTRELATLLAKFKQTGPDGRLVILEGETGIGKTRLAEEFLAQVGGAGTVTIAARGYEGQGNLAYGPFIEGLRALDLTAEPHAWTTRLAPQALAEAARLLPELAALGPLPPLPPLEGPGGQSRFLDSISQLLLALCGAEGCCVLALDDLQWIDAASLDLLTYLVRRLRGHSLFVLGAWRPEEVAPDHRLRQLLAEAERNGAGLLLPLKRLDRNAVMELVGAAKQNGAVIAPELAERLYRESEGQPFMLVEYLALLASGEPEGDGPPGSAGGKWSLPGSVRSALLARLARLSETARQLLGAGAVIGRSFDFDTVNEASGRSAEETVTGLEELLAHGLIQEVRTAAAGAPPILDFAHEKLRALVYEEMSLVRRRLLHRRVAEALANRARVRRELGQRAKQIAYHFEQAGQDRDAAEYYRRAGDHARSLYANAEALADYRSALALGDPDPAGLHEAIGDLQTLSGEYRAALHSYETAAAFRDGRATGGLESKMADLYARRGEWEPAEQYFQHALDSLGEAAPGEARSKIYGDWSLAALRRGDPTRARELANRALELAEAARDRRALAQAHNLLGILARHAGRPDEAQPHLEQARALAESLDDPGLRSAALNNLALVQRDRGEMARGVECAEQALALSQAQGDRHREAALHNNLADLYHAAGDAEAAMRHLRAAVTIYAEIGAEAGTWQPEIWKLAEW